MSFPNLARRILTVVLIATLIPAPGFAWHAAAFRPDTAPRAPLAARAFLETLNALPQATVASGRPQIYLVYVVDVDVPATGQPTITTEEADWFEDFVNGLTTAAPTGATRARPPNPPRPPAEAPVPFCNVPCVPAPAALAAAPPRPARPPDEPIKPFCNVPCVANPQPVAGESILDEIEEMEAYVRSLPSATILAGMPGSIPFESNPDSPVSLEYQMGMAISEALQGAGVDDPEGNGRSTFTRGTGKVAYEVQTPDGEIVVGGRLVDGRIVLTKEFKPLTGSGEVGEPVRIRPTPQGAPAVNQASGTQTGAAPRPPSNVQTATSGTPALPPGARAIPAEVVREWGQELYAEFDKRGQQVGGPRDGQGRLLDRNGEVIAPTTVASLKLVQDAVVTDLQTFTEHLQEVQALPREHKVALGQDLEGAAAALRVAAAAHDKAKATFEAFLPSEHLYNNSMTRAIQLEKTGDRAGAAEMRAQAAATPYGQYVAARTRYVELLNQTPLLGIKQDGRFLYDAFGDPSQFPSTAAGQTSIAGTQRYVDLLNRYLAAGVAQTKEQAAELAAYNTIEQLAVFASAAYAYVHERLVTMGTMIGSTVTADMMAELRAAANGSLKSWSDAAWQKIADRSLIVLQIGCMFLPGGPLIALGLAGLQILRAGKDTVVAHIEHEDATKRAAAAGFEHVVQTGDNTAEAARNLVWTTGLSAFDVYGAAQYTRLMRLVRAEQAAARAAQQAVPGSAATTPGAASAPAGSTPPPRAAATTQQPPREAGWDPSVTPPKTEAEIQALFKQQVIAEAQRDAASEVVAEIKLARAAGVDEQAIKDLTKGFDPREAALWNRMMADALMKARLAAQGYDITMPREDFRKLQGMSVRAGVNGSGLTPDDIAWLNAHAHPGYFEGLPRRGFMTGFAQNPFHGSGSGMPTEGFMAALDADAAMRLQAAWKAQGGQFNPGAANDTVGTQILRPGTVAAAGADETGTVILRPGGQTQTPTVRMDPNRTAMMDPNNPNPTVRIDPNKTAIMDPANPNPTIRLDPNSTAMMDPNATARMADDVMRQIASARQQGLTPPQLAATVRSAMARANVAPQQLVSALRERFFPGARSVSMTEMGGQGAAAAPGLDVSLVALGVSSGTAFTVKAINRSGLPIALRGEGVVVEPLPGGRPSVTPAAGTPAATQPVEAFCLERLRPVATEGMAYRVAPPSVQAEHRGLVSVLHAAKRVADAGGLHPDSELKGYFNFVRQWAIWSRQEKFDEKRFTTEFVNQTKKNVEGQNMGWTKDMEDVIKKAAPGRWRDITAILNEANAPKEPEPARGEQPGTIRPQAAIQAWRPRP